MAKRKRRRIAEPFTDEAFEALRRKQNIKKIKASIKRAGGFGKVLKATGYQHIGDDSFMQILESMTDEDLRQLADERKVRSKVAILSRSGMIEKRSDSRSLVGADIRRGEQQQLEVISMLDRDANRFNNNGHNIRVLNVFGGTEETMYVDKLLAIAEYGENYNGWYGKADSSAIPFINKTGKKLADMITSARMKHTDKEIYDRVEHNYRGGLQGLADDIEKLVLSIYDPIYREIREDQKNHKGLYEQELDLIRNILSF